MDAKLSPCCERKTNFCFVPHRLPRFGSRPNTFHSSCTRRIGISSLIDVPGPTWLQVKSFSPQFLHQDRIIIPNRLGYRPRFFHDSSSRIIRILSPIDSVIGQAFPPQLIQKDRNFIPTPFGHYGPKVFSHWPFQTNFTSNFLLSRRRTLPTSLLGKKRSRE